MRVRMRYAGIEEDKIREHIARSAHEAWKQMSEFLSHPELSSLRPDVFVEQAGPYEVIARA